MADEVKFDATVQKVQTLVDYGLRVTLDLPESAIVAAAQLMALKREGAILHVSIFPDKQVTTEGKDYEHGAIQARPEWEPGR